MHLAGTSVREISVRDETQGQKRCQGKGRWPRRSKSGLSSWGEFGYLPRVILSDTLQGTVKPGVIGNRQPQA